MELYKEWQEKLESKQEDQGGDTFFSNYIEKETNTYDSILKENRNQIKGRVEDLANEFDMDNVIFMGFLDGINSSLKHSLKLENITEKSEIELEIDWEKLYYNMLAAKANWLYSLDSWKEILSEETRTEIRIKHNEEHRAVSNKVGRNDPCPCGSGKKYKKCCAN